MKKLVYILILMLSFVFYATANTNNKPTKAVNKGVSKPDTIKIPIDTTINVDSSDA